MTIDRPATLSPLFPIVGIGASAGGLDAISELLSALPLPSGMVFILVQHLDPSKDSMLAELLGRKTSMKVMEAHDGSPLCVDCFYIIPPNKTLTVDNGTLSVIPRIGVTRDPGPIDILFSSMAGITDRRVVAVVLSGAGSDGTRGAQELKEAGGIVIAQDPASAAFASMPRSVIDAGLADMILRPAEIGHKLTGLRDALISTDNKPVSHHETATPTASAELWKRLFSLLREACGMDFTHYKRSTLERRVQRRQTLLHIAALEDYIDLLSRDPGELTALSHDVLISVTSFFRDPDSFDDLSQLVFPPLLKQRATREPIRIWVPGCASGEEVYSIAISLMEHLGTQGTHVPVQIFGTDASETAIARAREGSYPEGIVSEVLPARLTRYFIKTDHHYRISKPIRDLCVFARHDVTRDPPFSRIDLISCRNLLIYLDSTLQRQLFTQFHYALRPNGFLTLGRSETVGASSDLFDLVDKKRRVFKRHDSPSTIHSYPSARSSLPLPSASEYMTPPLPAESGQLRNEIERMLLAHYVPAAIVVDDDLIVHQFRGPTANYLQHASGPASLNLQQLAAPSLMIPLMPALREARTTQAPVLREKLRLTTDRGTRVIDLEINPFWMADNGSTYYLVVFKERWRDRRQSIFEKFLDAAARRAPGASAASLEIKHLRVELSTTREFLQSRMDDHETVKNELRSLHEEALSANEELQSTNEELETAKEELQSTNEEIATTNDELRIRNQQMGELNEALTAARDFAEAIVETVRHPLLVLDRRLRVQSANMAFCRLTKARQEDIIGRHFYDIDEQKWNIPELRDLLEFTALASGTVENFRVAYRSSENSDRIMLVNARRLLGKRTDDEMILLGIEDTTEDFRIHARLEDSHRRKDEFLATLGHELRNPLAPMRSVVNVMRGFDIRSDEVKRCVEILDRQTEHMVRLVDDLLEMSRITRGTPFIDMTNVSLDEVVERSVEAIRPFMEARKHKLTVSSPGSIHVSGDIVRLTQIVTNLLNNAAKYTPMEGQIDLLVKSEDTSAVIVVSDNGQGMNAELIPQIFEAFSQGAGHSRAGLGLGLALSRRLTEMLGGTIEAFSEGLGKGSTFTVRLPRLVDTVPNMDRAAIRTESSPIKGYRILIVDDNVDAAQALKMILDFEGGNTRCACDGATALQMAQAFNPDVVLLDIGLPDIDGYEVLRRLRTSPGIKPKVIALSGFDQPGDITKIRDAGFDGNLRKPAESGALLSLIATVQPHKLPAHR